MLLIIKYWLWILKKETKYKKNKIYEIEFYIFIYVKYKIIF